MQVLVWIFLTSANAQQPASACRELKIDEVRNFDEETQNGSLRVLRKFRLKRVDEKQFELGFNPVFEDSKVADKFDACFASGYSLEAPGQKRIQILKNKTAPAIKIKRPARAFQMFDAWHVGATCQVMAHELLHQAGLTDEYEKFINKWETQKSENTQPSPYKCRLIREDNLMGSTSPQARNTLSADQFEVITAPGCVHAKLYDKCTARGFDRDPDCKLPPECSQLRAKPESSGQQKKPVVR